MTMSITQSGRLALGYRQNPQDPLAAGDVTQQRGTPGPPFVLHVPIAHGGTWARPNRSVKMRASTASSAASELRTIP